LDAPDKPVNPETPAAKGFRLEGPPPETDLQTGYHPDIRFKERHAQVAKILAFSLLAILAGGMAVHYACVMILIMYGRDYGAKFLEDSFHAWLPVVSGLAGAATAYYFSKDGK
jgi:hypothetical protein